MVESSVQLLLLLLRKLCLLILPCLPASQEGSCLPLCSCMPATLHPKDAKWEAVPASHCPSGGRDRKTCGDRHRHEPPNSPLKMPHYVSL